MLIILVVCLIPWETFEMVIVKDRYLLIQEIRHNKSIHRKPQTECTHICSLQQQNDINYRSSKKGRQAPAPALQPFYLFPGYPDAPQRLPFITGRAAPLALTTGRCTSQNARSWLSRIFLSILSLFLSTLSMLQDV